LKYIKTYESNNGTTFKEWLKYNPQDINTTEIDCSNTNLINLEGIDQFTNLKYLICHNNYLSILPDLSNLINLEKLYCSNNKLPYNDLEEYMEWHKKNFPWIWNANKYNL
jgi:Leucine-rich repeat (LRR) protein